MLQLIPEVLDTPNSKELAIKLVITFKRVDPEPILEIIKGSFQKYFEESIRILLHHQIFSNIMRDHSFVFKRDTSS